MRAECVSCRRLISIAARGLCGRCYSDEAIRDTIPPRNPWRKWTTAQTARLRELVAANTPLAECAAALNRSPASVTSRLSVLALRRTRKRRITAPQLAALRAHLDAHPDQSSVAASRALSLPLASVRYNRLKHGMPRLTPSQRSTAANRTRTTSYAPAQTRVLDALASGPATVAQLAARCFVARSAVYLTLYALRRRGAAFCEGSGFKGRGHAPGTLWYSLTYWLESNIALVEFHAKRVAKLFPGSSVAELVSAAYPALVRSAKNMRPRGVKFATFSAPAVVGEMKTAARESQLCGLKVSRAKRFTAITAPAPLTEVVAPSDQTAPDFWARIVSSLSTVEARVVLAYHRDHRTMREIGDSLGLTESRVSGIHRAAIARIRETKSLDSYAQV